jgi:hypothetical protein
MATQYTLKGINDDQDTCSCCGKTGLKRVMWLMELDAEGNESGEVFPMGTTCGAKKLGMSSKSVSIQGDTESYARYAQTLLAKGLSAQQASRALSQRFGRGADTRHNEFVLMNEDVCYRVTVEKVERINMGQYAYLDMRLARLGK